MLCCMTVLLAKYFTLEEKPIREAMPVYDFELFSIPFQILG